MRARLQAGGVRVIGSALMGAATVALGLVLASGWLPAPAAQSRTLVAGQTTLISATAVTLTTNGLNSVEVIIQNDPASTVNVFVGDATAQYLKLIPGASVTVPIDNLGTVYIKRAAAGSSIVNWLARTN